MFALDLFNNDHERRIAEGAVDQLEQRRIDDLAMKMDDLVARAKNPAYKKNPAALAALMKEFQKCKDERDGYFKIKSEAGIPGNVPVEKIPGKEDLLKGRGRSYYEAEESEWTKEGPWTKTPKNKTGRPVDPRGEVAHLSDVARREAERKAQDQKKNTREVNEYISMGSDKNYVEAEPYKNYKIYVRKKPFGPSGMYTAHTEIDRKESKAPGASQEEAVQAIRDRIDFVLNAQKKVTGSSTIDFNVKFATDLLADPRQKFYAKLENINGEPKLVIASADVASDSELVAAGDFKGSALRNQVDDEGRATPLPGIPLTAKSLRVGDWIANGRYTIGNETTDRDGNRIFDLTYHSTAHTKSDKLRLNQPAFTLGTARELDEDKQLHVGDPITVTAPNEFEGKTGEIYDFAPSGTFVIVDLYNHGKHSMHLSDVEYNQYADENNDDWYDDIDDGVRHAYDSDERTRSDQFEGYQDSSDSPVAGAITRRILLQRLDLLKQYGPELVGAAVDNVADYVGDVDEIGSSDVSGWIMQVERMLKENPPEAFDEGWSDAMVAQRTGGPRTPYSVYIKGKKWKDFENDDHAEAVANKLRAKFKADGRDPSVITIAPTDMSEGMAEGKNNIDNKIIHLLTNGIPADAIARKLDIPVEWVHEVAKYNMPDSDIDYNDPRNSTQGRERFGEQGVAEAEGRVDPILIKALDRMPDGLATHGEVLGAAYDAYAMELGRMAMKSNYGTTNAYIPQLLDLYKQKHGLTFNEAANPAQQAAIAIAMKKAGKKPKSVDEGAMSNVHAAMADVYHRLAPKIERHRDSFLAGQLYDELENIAELHGIEPEFKRMMAGARNRAHMDYDTNPGGFQNWFWYLPFAEEDLSEEQDTSGVERAILNRIMVAHTDLLMKFGPDKVMQAAEEVAYNVGDVDEIGTSDVSAYVNQVRQILGA